MTPNGREPFAKSRDSDANEGGVWLSAAEAAAALGTSVRTVQKRAARGEYVSRTDVNRRLFVCVSLPDQDANVRDSSPNIREPDANALLNQLRSENQFLRSQVENHAAEIVRRDTTESEYRRLLLTDRQEIGRLREHLSITAATAPESTDSAPGSTNDIQSVSANEGAKTGALTKTRWKRFIDYWKS